MNFLEAHRLAIQAADAEPLHFLLAMSGTPQKLGTFLGAAAALRGRAAKPQSLDFGTLNQWLLTAPEAEVPEVVLLFPWDLAPELDWRSGMPHREVDEEELRGGAERAAARLAGRRSAKLVYVAAPALPVLPTPAQNTGLAGWLTDLVAQIGAELLPGELFSLGGYLSSGSPFSGKRLHEVAEVVVRLASGESAAKKVLITDLDNVMWSGIIGEDGVDGVRCAAEGTGYRHFIYQGALAQLQRQGVLLAAVSRNDEDLALAPFRAGHTLLAEEHLVAVLASYGAKSTQVGALAERLSLGLDSFVFVDDNPVEIAEVSARHPEVTCLTFPTSEEGLPQLLDQIRALFPARTATAEDRERTALYRRRLAGIAPSSVEGADLTAFLRDLSMELTIHDRTSGERERAVQLINKTNQFNLNGVRRSEAEVERFLATGGRIYTATLRDRHGSHGEILSCMLGPDGCIESLVMSCRVLQRRVEYAFLAWLARLESPPRALAYVRTERNAPLQQYLEDPAFRPEADGRHVSFDAEDFLSRHGDALDLFRLVEELQPVSVG